jgi:hypothetical protein
LLDSNVEIPAKAMCLMRRAGASAEVITATAVACLDPAVSFARGSEKLQKSQAVVLKCSCSHGKCYKVLKAGTLFEALRLRRRNPLACPADPGSTCATYSSHVAKFLNIISGVLGDSIVIRDWVDVPRGHRRHFDSTVISVTRAFHAWRFEIDGKRHFLARGTKRDMADWEKDDILNSAGVSLLRLHHKDEQRWGQDVVAFMGNPEGRVVYSPAYYHCLQYQPEIVNVRGQEVLGS